MVGTIAQRHVPHALILDWGPPPLGTFTPQQWGAIYWWRPIADIACYAFPVRTTIDGQPPTEDGILAYKRRVGKGIEVQTRREALTAQFTLHSTGYAPLDFPLPTRIRYRAMVLDIDMAAHILRLKAGHTYRYNHLISTIPLPSLLALRSGPAMYDPAFDAVGNMDFGSQNIFVTVEPSPVITQVMEVDYQTTGEAYRVTRHLDGTLHHEFAFPAPPTRTVLRSKRLIPGRIYDSPYVPVLVRALQAYDVQCFGRYARWDSDELLHMTDADIAEWAAQHASSFTPGETA